VDAGYDAETPTEEVGVRRESAYDNKREIRAVNEWRS
jgi:hypothetical protein